MASARPNHWADSSAVVASEDAVGGATLATAEGCLSRGDMTAAFRTEARGKADIAGDTAGVDTGVVCVDAGHRVVTS